MPQPVSCSAGRRASAGCVLGLLIGTSHKDYLLPSSDPWNLPARSGDAEQGSSRDCKPPAAAGQQGGWESNPGADF